MTRGPTKDYLRIGVTGGIGSGKSTVCGIFERMGRTVISADALARDVTEHDEEVRQAIKTAFGSHLYGTDGFLQRKELAAIVFRDRRSREKLNAIVHPRVFQDLEAAIARLDPRKRAPYVLIEAALVYETGLNGRLDYTIVVDAPEEVRIARVMRRDGCTRADVRLRMNSQMKVENKLRRADLIIDNSGNEQELAGRVAFLDSLLRHMGPDSRRGDVLSTP